jgi:hypothetical protein
MSTPRSRPSDPAQARSPKEEVPFGWIPPPLTRSGTGSAVWAFRAHDVEWSAATATIVRRRSLTPLASRIRAGSLTNAFVRSVARRASSVQAGLRLAR